MSSKDIAKRAAAAQALDYVSPGMRLGLGSGSTAELFVELLGARAREQGWDLTCVATSQRTAKLAESVGLTVADLNDVNWLDLVVDGADEVDEELNLIKGGGGALLREKIVADSADEMIVIADDSKMVEQLGAFRLPVEIVKFGWRATKARIEDALDDFDVADDVEGALRMAGDAPFVTDEGHYIVDFALQEIGDAEELAGFLSAVPGVVEHGLFINMCARVIVGDADGEAEVIDLEDEWGEED